MPALGREISNVIAHAALSSGNEGAIDFGSYRQRGGNCIHLHDEGGETRGRRATGQWLAHHGQRADFVLCAAIGHDDWDEAARRPIEQLYRRVRGPRGTLRRIWPLLQTDYLDIVYLSDRASSPP